MALDQLEVNQPAKVKEVEKEMSFFEHLEELRWHLIRSLAVVLVLAVVFFLAKDFVFNTLLFGPKRPDFITYRLFCQFSHWMNMGESLCFGPPAFDFVTPDFGETFMTHIKVSFVLGLVVAFPYFFWEIWRFVKPGLVEKEKQLTRYVVAVCSSLFLLGVAFGYFVISPFAVSFLAGYELPGVKPLPSLGSYINYMVMLTLPVGMVFELPVAAYILAKLGVLSSAFMKQYRKHAIVIIVAVAAVITPPDVFSQIFVSLPLILLYEVSIYIARRIEKKQAATPA